MRLDLCGLVCPLPLIRLQQALSSVPAGGIAEVTADDAGFADDLPDWCRQTGHGLLQLLELEPGRWYAQVRKH